MNDEPVPVNDSGTTIDATLPTKRKVAFRVCWGETADRATGAVVILEPSGDAAIPGTPFAVDEDGDLDVELEAGGWSCTAVHPDGRQLKPRSLKIPDDVPDPGKKVVLQLYSLTRDINQTWGRWTFAILIVMLAVLIWAWVDSHRRHPDPAVPSRASAMLDTAARLRATLAEADDPRGTESFLASLRALDSLLDSSGLNGELKKKLVETAKQKEAMGLLLLTDAEKVTLELQQLEILLGEAGEGSDPGIAGALATTTGALNLAMAEIESGTEPNESRGLKELVAKVAELREKATSEDFRLRFTGHEQRLQTLMAVEEEMGDETLIRLLLEKIAALESTLPALASAELEASEGSASSTLWSKPPKLYLEILFWATAGILVQLIITIAGYLRWNTFIKNGIYLHAALLITVPLLTLVFVQIISMGRLTADDSTVVLDLSDPRIVAGAAFLIALVPWGLWDRIRGAGRKVLGDNGGGA